MTDAAVLPKIVNVDPVTRFVRSLPGDWRLLREVSGLVGVSQFTLRRYIDDNIKECLPSKVARIGKMHVYLYSAEDIASIERYLRDRTEVVDFDGKRKRRAPIYTSAERIGRKRARSRKWYWEDRARALAEAGDKVGAQDALRRAKEIGEELKASGKR